MKERFLRMGIGFNGQNIIHYIKEVKSHWWSKWKIVMDGAAPLIFYKLPEGVRAVNELPSFIIKDGNIVPTSTLPPPTPPFPKGDVEVRKSMMDMVCNADEIYVGIMQDGKYYVATDTESIQSCKDLQSLEIIDEEH